MEPWIEREPESTNIENAEMDVPLIYETSAIESPYPENQIDINKLILKTHLAT